MDDITINSGISIQDIIDYPNLNWDIKHIVLNENLTFKTIIENKIINEFGAPNSIIHNNYGYDEYAKHRKDVKFPQYWLTVYYLYKYIYDQNKPIKEVYEIAKFIIKNTLDEQMKTLITNLVPSEIIQENKQLSVPSVAYEGYLSNSIRKSITNGYKIKIEVKITRTMIENFVKDYFNEGGFHIKIKVDKFDKKTCGDDKEFFTQEDFKDLDEKDLVSFELNKQIFCLNREDLINFWNQELDENGSSGAFNYGNCRYNEDDEVFEDTCKKFYKIPIPATYISKKDKKQIEENTEIKVWKLVFDKNVKMGRGLHYIGEYTNDKEPIYKVKSKTSYQKV